MTYELDHIFILSDVDAPTADKLVEAGIKEGRPNTHTGQGTTNRRFYFDNAMIEFLWVHDVNEAGSAFTNPTYLLPRWQGRMTSASPFGICFRPTVSNGFQAPFPIWHYKPQYLPKGQSIQIAQSVDQITEPFLFYSSWVKTDELPNRHPVGMKNISHVAVTHPYSDLSSPTMDAISHLITFEVGETHLLTVTFDGGIQSKTLDFQPDLPLVFHF